MFVQFKNYSISLRVAIKCRGEIRLYTGEQRRPYKQSCNPLLDIYASVVEAFRAWWLKRRLRCIGVSFENSKGSQTDGKCQICRRLALQDGPQDPL